MTPLTSRACALSLGFFWRCMKSWYSVLLTVARNTGLRDGSNRSSNNGRRNAAVSTCHSVHWLLERVAWVPAVNCLCQTAQSLLCLLLLLLLLLVLTRSCSRTACC